MILETVGQAQERSGQPVRTILNQLPLSRATYGRRPGTPYRWQERAQSGHLADQVVAPQRHALPPMPDEVAAVCDFALAHPATGYKRLTWLMVDQDVAFLRPYQVYCILKGRDLLARQPEPASEALTRPPAPDHSDPIWYINLPCPVQAGQGCICSSDRVGIARGPEVRATWWTSWMATAAFGRRPGTP